MTIIEAIKRVIRSHGSPLTAKEAYDAIVAQNLYEFHAQRPMYVVQVQIRRHSEGIDFPTASPLKHFRLVGENKFWPLEEPRRGSTEKRRAVRHKPSKRLRLSSLNSTLRSLKDLHARYVSLLKEQIIAELRKLRPADFETFAKQLFQVYGFEDTQVTKLSGDGGIDGYGKLRVGLAHLNVAFQCKRWTKGNIQRTEIDKFRGAAQGDFEQGVFFATTSFSQGAIDASIKRGAIPIVLVDSDMIVDLMIRKQFGVETEPLVIPIIALDLALTPEHSESDSPGGANSKVDFSHPKSH